MKIFLKIFPALSLAVPGDVGFATVVFVVLVTVVTFVGVIVPKGCLVGLYKNHNLTHNIEHTKYDNEIVKNLI